MPSLKPPKRPSKSSAHHQHSHKSVISGSITKSKKAPEKLTIADVANSLKVSYHKNNIAKKAPNPYLSLMFENLSSTHKPKKVVNDRTFELLKFARVVNPWIRRNIPLTPCNKEFAQQLKGFDLSLAANDYLLSKYSNYDQEQISNIKKVGGGTCGHFSRLALNAILGHEDIENIVTELVILENPIEKSTHVIVVIKSHENDRNAVVIDAHSENAEPCLLRDMRDKLDAMGYTELTHNMHTKPKIKFSALDAIKFTPKIVVNHRNDKIKSSSLTKTSGEEVLYDGFPSLVVKHSPTDSKAYYGGMPLMTIFGEFVNVNLGRLIKLRKDNHYKFIFINTQIGSGCFNKFPNLFSDIPYQYTNSKGETIPKGEEIMNIDTSMDNLINQLIRI